MPPEVGYAETSSDMVNPMSRMKAEMIGQPHEIAMGPPLLKPWPKVVKQPARIEMIENEIAKFEKPDQVRLSSCLYPSFGRDASSSELDDEPGRARVLRACVAPSGAIVRM